MRDRLREIATRKPVVVDSRYDVLAFGGVTVVKPNEDEAIAATAATDGSMPHMQQAAGELIERLGVEAVLLTLGNQGMLLRQRESDPVLLPVEGTDEIVDLTGAGDTVAATFTVAVTSGASYRDAAYLANCAAGIAVMKEGAAIVRPGELRAALAARSNEGT
jgi:bifunctional ADP-heptose synthase (sugar kinase/adenylyltransferase)